MARLVPLLNDEQWEFLDALVPAAQAESVIVMPGVRLQHWVPRLPSGLQTHLTQQVNASLLRNLGDFFRRSSILFSLVRTSGDTATLCLAVCDDGFSARILREVGVEVISWQEAQSLAAPQELVSLASDAYISENSCAVRRRHLEEETLKDNLSTALLLEWPKNFSEEKPDPEFRAIIDAFIAERNESMALLNEVAISRFIGPNDNEATPDEARILATSSIDLLVHARPPHNAPLLAVEYDGRFHESDSRKIANDKAKDAIFGRAGLALLRIRSSEARAAEYWNRHTRCTFPVHPRLPFLLRIASVISQREVTRLQRSRELAPLVQLEARNLLAAGRALFGKNLNQLTPEQQIRVFESATPPEGTDSDLLFNEWEIEDQMDQQDRRSWEWHLQSAKVPDDAIVETVQVERSDQGWSATTVMQHRGRKARIRLRTETILLRAPTLTQDEIEDLVRAELFADLATQIRSRLEGID